MVEHGLSLLSHSFTHTPELTDHLREQILFWVTLQSLGGDQFPLPSYGRSWLEQMSWGTHLSDVLCPASALLSPFRKPYGLRPVQLEWELESSKCQVAPICHHVSGHGFLWYSNNCSTAWLLTWLSGQYTRNRGVGKRQVALKDLEQQGLFSTSTGSEELPPKAECSGYLLYTINFPLKQLRSLPSPGSPSSSVVRVTKITDTEAVIDEQKLLTQDKGRESKGLLMLIGGFDLTLTSKQHLR